MISIIVSELGFEKHDMGKVYLIIGLIVVLFLSLAIVQRINSFLRRRDKQKSAWRTFARLAKVRGLIPAEIRVLTLAAKRARIKRPSEVLASMQVFDKCVNEFLYFEEVRVLRSGQ